MFLNSKVEQCEFFLSNISTVSIWLAQFRLCNLLKWLVPAAEVAFWNCSCDAIFTTCTAHLCSYHEDASVGGAMTLS